ncbi:MAG: OmpA family protein [Flavobacteriaceae bacterium]|nr:MAG: OmpA family protein [Flavobacteriaceae bacterium]
MKKQLLLFLAFFVSILITEGQNNKGMTDNQKTSSSVNRWTVKAGVNFVDNSGGAANFNTQNFAFGGFPARLNLGYRFSKLLSFEIGGSLNKWKAGGRILDGSVVNEDQNYFALDGNFQFYFDEAFNLFWGADWLEVYLNGGIGYFKIDKGATSANVGPGVNIWFSKGVGLNFDALAKWAFNSSERFDTNHIQYSSGLIFRFQNEDKDNDGIYDYNDDCPSIPGTRNSNGCPDDGSTNSNDKNTSEQTAIVQDTDKDGVIDSGDNCPKIAGSPNNNGCPLSDSDGDGVLDRGDNCPDVVGSPNNNGCPLPSDGNSVSDTAEETDNNGHSKKLSKETSETLTALSRKVKFNSGNYNFTQDTYSILQSIVEVMKENPNAKFRIEGHTDSVGEYNANRVLSKSRASAVRNYLVDNGIPQENISILGMGESKPIDTNLTKEGRSRNRRIEITEIE